MIFTSKRFGNVEPPHSAKLLFFLEKEKLVGLHGKLTTYPVVVIHYNIVNIFPVQFFPYG